MLSARENWKLAWRAARKLVRRLTYSWPQNKELAIYHYNKKYGEEVCDLPLIVTIKSSMCYFDREHWQDQSVQRWLKYDIRRKLP